jgi:CubicO group peptidase (beta-lactamase class C family)
VIELARFLAAYMQGGVYDGRRILKATTISEMLEPQTPLDKSQGLVWYSEEIDGRTVWGHDGSDNGACAGMWFDPEKKTGAIVMANGVCQERKVLIEKLLREADEY